MKYGTAQRPPAEAQQDAFRDELGDLAAKIDELAKSVDEGLKGTSIFLVGMMGSGKSTTGRMVANVLRYCFFDCDAVIEQAVGGATISEVFAANGESGFRDIEQSVLMELSAYKNCVIATGGGVVARPQNWGSMQVGVTVYLEGPVDLLARRIMAEDGGDSRPMLAEASSSGTDPEAATRERLAALLKERDASYRNADCTVSLKGSGQLGASAAEMVYRVLSAVDEKVKASAAEREDRKQFEIKNEGTIPMGG